MTPLYVGITGHRPDKLGGEYDLAGPVTKAVRKWCQDMIYHIWACGEINFIGISGMALGVDQIWAEECLRAGQKLLACLPFEGQENKWRGADQDRFNTILAHPNTRKVVVCDGGYEAWKMQKRNEYMVDHSDLMLAVWDESGGGTANCVKYAADRKPMLLFDPTLQPITCESCQRKVLIPIADWFEYDRHSAPYYCSKTCSDTDI